VRPRQGGPNGLAETLDHADFIGGDEINPRQKPQNNDDGEERRKGAEFSRQGQAVNGKGLFQLPQCFLDIGTVPTAPGVSLISMPCHGFFPPEDFKLSPVTL